MSHAPVGASQALAAVRYEIRGDLARRAHELERKGYEIVHLNIGNPGRFRFRTPETMRLAMIENLSASEAYSHQKGIFPAREAVVMQQQNRGVMDVSVDDVVIGNGVSELIDLTMRALLNPGDKVLIPSPDYPLWTAAVVLNGGEAAHYPCPPQAGFIPDIDAMEALIDDRTRAIVVINPNNPTGAVYDNETLEAIVELAERHGLVIFSDEIYDQMLYEAAAFVPMATLVHHTMCVTLSGLSKVYRACGYRVGWAIFSGDRSRAEDYLHGVELLASLRLCSNVPGQWSVQTALGGYQSVYDLTTPGGRLWDSRAAALSSIDASQYLTISAPSGAMYGFPGVDTTRLPNFDDYQFCLDLLERQHVLLAPGSSFNVPYRNHFRFTLLPDEHTLEDVFERIETQLNEYANV